MGRGNSNICIGMSESENETQRSASESYTCSPAKSPTTRVATKTIDEVNPQFTLETAAVESEKHRIDRLREEILKLQARMQETRQKQIKRTSEYKLELEQLQSSMDKAHQHLFDTENREEVLQTRCKIAERLLNEKKCKLQEIETRYEEAEKVRTAFVEEKQKAISKHAKITTMIDHATKQLTLMDLRIKGLEKEATEIDEQAIVQNTELEVIEKQKKQAAEELNKLREEHVQQKKQTQQHSEGASQLQGKRKRNDVK
ncbi:unnamed protein product [Orchesella dallaii]|uniref:Uncharacterized protein n=1 Tax=Orchesella dallaii TaxID=48710 RepID=A0ABP1RNZ9_9HEXA